MSDSNSNGGMPKWYSIVKALIHEEVERFFTALKHHEEIDNIRQKAIQEDINNLGDKIREASIERSDNKRKISKVMGEPGERAKAAWIVVGNWLIRGLNAIGVGVIIYLLTTRGA